MTRFRLLMAALFCASSFFGTALVTTVVTTAGMAVFDADTVEAQTRRPRKKRTRKKRTRRRKPTSFVGMRGGFVLTAPGEASIGDNSRKFNDDSAFGISGLAIFPIQSNIRGGASLWLFPGYQAAGNGVDVEGTMIELNAIGEFVLPMSREVDGFGFVDAGLAILNADDDDLGDFLGFDAGIGIGGQFLVSSSFAIRAEGKFEFYTMTNNNDVETTLSAQRVMLNIGAMFGL